MSRLASLALFISGFAVLGCDATESETIVGVGRIWAYSSPSSAVLRVEYREFSQPTTDCPPETRLDDYCVYSNCGYAPSELPPPHSAGRITVRGGVQDFVVEPTDGAYPPAELEGALFEGGESLEFDVSGDDDIPATSATLTAPERASVTSPSLEEISEIELATDLELGWNPLTRGNVIVSLGVTQEDGDDWIRSISLSCTYEGWRSGARIPAKHLEKLPATTEEVPGQIWIGTTERASTRSGRWQHWFALTAYEDASVSFSK